MDGLWNQLALMCIAVFVVPLLAWVQYELIHQRRAVMTANELLERTAQTADVGGWEFDVRTGQLRWSRQTHRLCGTDPSTFHPTPRYAMAMLERIDRRRFLAAARHCIRTGKPWTMDVRIRTTSGERLWARVRGAGETDGMQASRLSGTIQNIEDSWRQEQALKRSELLHRTLADNVSDLVSLHDLSGRALYLSPSVHKMTGFQADELLGRTGRSRIHPQDVERMAAVYAKAVSGAADQSVAFRFRCKNGQYIWLESRFQHVTMSDGTLAMVVASRDTTERRAIEEEMRYRAHHDSLTGLPNRQAILKRLEEHVQTRSSEPLALIFFDVDNFKSVNDTQGHHRGDELLCQLAGRLRDHAPADGFVGRLSGDEFVGLLTGVDCVQRASAFAEAIVESFQRPFALQGGPAVFLSASAGIAMYPHDATRVTELLAAADMAMYAVKEGGKNACQRYDHSIAQKVAGRASALQQVRNAYERNNLELFYQPKVNLADGAVVGFEALLRLRSVHGYELPTAFIKAAEDSGFISTLGAWVIETAAEQSRAWRAQGLSHPIAVNISGKQLQSEHFVQHIRYLVEQDPLLPRYLQLELTESAIAMDATLTLRIAQELARMGFALHIDDFGTGYSSLSCVSQLPLDTLKIDRAFTASMLEDKGAQEVVGVIMALARALDLNVVAEGVETAEQCRFLMDAGCTQAQGVLFAKALPVDEALRFARSRTRVYADAL